MATRLNDLTEEEYHSLLKLIKFADDYKPSYNSDYMTDPDNKIFRLKYRLYDGFYEDTFWTDRMGSFTNFNMRNIVGLGGTGLGARYHCIGEVEQTFTRAQYEQIFGSIFNRDGHSIKRLALNAIRVVGSFPEIIDKASDFYYSDLVSVFKGGGLLTETRPDDLLSQETFLGCDFGRNLDLGATIQGGYSYRTVDAQQTLSGPKEDNNPWTTKMCDLTAAYAPHNTIEGGALYYTTMIEIVEANFPILTNATEAEMFAFVTGQDESWDLVEDANLPNDVERDEEGEHVPEEKTYYLYEKYEIYRDDGFGNKTLISSGTRNIRYKQMTPNKTCLYLTGSSDDYDMKLMFDDSADAWDFQWSDGGRYNVDQTGVHWDEFVSKGAHYNKSGYIVQTTYFATNIPIFRSLQQANDFQQGTVGEDAAENADDLDSKLPGKHNPIGDEVTSTPLGEGYTANGFNKVYALTSGQLANISGKLFNTDTSIMDAIKQGLELYGANPMDVIIDLAYYPVDISKLTAMSVQDYIMFGTYKMDVNGVNFITKTRGQMDFGTVLYPLQFEDFRDFEPYTELYIYLPYCGVHKLNVSTYYGKSINLKYIVDLATGTCTAVLLCNGIIADMFDGNIAVKMPITAIDYAQYGAAVFSSMVDTLTLGIGTITGLSVAGAASTRDSMAEAGFGKMVAPAAATAKQAYNMTQTMNSQHIQMKGSSSPSASLCLPQYPYFITVVNETVVPDNEVSIVGRPSRYGGKLGNLTGYVECEKVRINTNATPSETAKIVTALEGGVYI